MEKPVGVSLVLFLSVLLSVCIVPTDLNVIVSTEEPRSSFEPTQLELWYTQLIDQWGWMGSIAFDSNNTPHVCYDVIPNFESTTRERLHYGVWNGTNWNIQNLDPKGIGGTISVDNNDNPHILYYTSPGNLKHTFWNGSNWTLNVVDSSGWCGRHYDIAMDSEGNPHIVYFQRETLELRYGVWTGSEWSVKVVGEPLTVEANLTPSIVLDSNNNPRIIYIEAVQYEIENPNSSNKEMHITHEVKYASWNGAVWLVQTVGHNASSVVGSLGNLVLDSKENPHFSYVSNVRIFNPETDSFWTKISLNYAHWDGSSWIVHPLESKPVSDNMKPYISLDNEQKANIYYFNEDSDRNRIFPKFWLNKAKWTGSDWKVETLDSNLTYADSIFKDSQGKLHLLFDEPMGTIRGAWRFGRLTYATFIGKTSNESIATWITVPLTIGIIVCIGLIIYYKKRK